MYRLLKSTVTFQGGLPLPVIHGVISIINGFKNGQLGYFTILIGVLTLLITPSGAHLVYTVVSSIIAPHNFNR